MVAPGPCEARSRLTTEASKTQAVLWFVKRSEQHNKERFLGSTQLRTDKGG